MLSQVQQLWTNLDTRARAMIIGVAALCVAALVALLRFGSAVEMTALYTGLAAEDAAAIVEKLKAERVPYRLSEGGATVTVPQEKVYELRIGLAKEGLPASGQVGFEIFDRSSLPGTQFSNQVNYQRALQGELARTIGAMQEVRSARVHLVLPEESLFSEKTKASAAVVVQPASGHELTPDTTAAIAQLVASAVKDVPAGEVTVVDTNGRVLHGPELGGSPGALAGTQLQIRQQYEERLAHSLQSMLDSVLGPSKSVVRVRTELDFDAQEVKTEALTPGAGGRGLVTTEKVKSEQYQGSAGGTGGSAGLEANITAPAVTVREGRGGSYTQKDETREYQYSRNSTSIVKAPGCVKALSVAAIIDEELPGTAEEQVRQLLTAAAGAQSDRGDTVTVQRMKISAAEAAQSQEAALAKQERSQNLRTWGRTALRSGMSLIAAVILFLTVNTVLKQMRSAALVAVPSPGAWENTTGEPGRGADSHAPLPTIPQPESPVDAGALREHLREVARQDAGVVADRLLAMLRDSQVAGRT
jgi:flagellar M-ring protein FliF